MLLMWFRSHFSVSHLQLSFKSTQAQFRRCRCYSGSTRHQTSAGASLIAELRVLILKGQSKTPTKKCMTEGQARWSALKCQWQPYLPDFPLTSSTVFGKHGKELKLKSESSLTGNTDTRNQQAQQSEPPAFRVAFEASRQNLTAAMERVQHMTKSAIRRASQIEVNPQAKRNLQELFVNFTLILICLLLIYIIVLLSSWGHGNRLTDGLSVRMCRSCVFTGIRLRYGEG